MGFPGSSAGKDSTCNAGDPSSIPGSERSAGEGIGYPLQSMGSQRVGHDWVTITLAVIMFAQEQCWDFPDSSVGKESTCNSGDPS